MAAEYDILTFMRIKNSMKNMIYIYSSTLLIVILNFIVRKVFLDVLTVDYLGYDGLFTSIFSFLSLSEMGIATVITYHMYSEIAAENTFQIRKLLYTYKLIYRIVGTVVLVLGIIASFFIPLMLNDSQKDSWVFIYSIYFLQLIATLCTYFLAYRRILFITHQRIYVCTAVDTATNIVSVILKMVVLLTLRNYIVYLLIAIIGNVVSNLIISIKSKKEYPEITSVEITRQDLRDLNLFQDVKNMLATKIAVTIYGAADDVIITYMLGITTGGLLNNYKMITSKIQELILSLFNSLQASIGSLVYDNDKEKGKAFFKALDLLGFLMAIVASTGIITVSQNFIKLWLKDEKYILPFSFLIVLGINVFIAIANNPMNYFRNSLGHFETDRNYMIAAAVVNIILSIILCIPLKLTGIFIGTVVGHLIIFTGRTIVVHKFFLEQSPIKYYLLFGFRFILLGISVTASVLLSNLLTNLIGNLLLSVIVSALVSIIISVIIFAVSSIKSEAFKVLLNYFKTVLNMLFKKKNA